VTAGRFAARPAHREQGPAHRRRTRRATPATLDAIARYHTTAVQRLSLPKPPSGSHGAASADPAV